MAESRIDRRVIIAAQRFTWFLGQALRLVFRLGVSYPEGRLRRRPGEPLILAPTHEHVLDPWLVLSALDYRTWRALTPVRILGTRDWTGWYRRLSWAIRALYRLYGVVELPPRSRKATREEKLRGLFDALDRGEVVAIFPEGHVRLAGEPPVRPFETGVVLLHRRSGAPVVPIAVRLCTQGPGRQCFSVAVGDPVAIPRSLGVDASAEWLRERARQLYGRTGDPA